MKENYFFKHDYNARTDPKLQTVLMDLGVAGIGTYWCVVEQLYEQDGFLPMSSLKSIAFSLHIDDDMLNKLLEDYGLFENDGKMFWSESINRRIADREELSEKRRSAIRKRWDKYKCNTNVSKNNTNVIQENKPCITTDNTCNTFCNTIKIEDKDRDKDKEKDNIARDNEKLLKKFFSLQNQIQIKHICDELHLTEDDLKAEVKEIISEWQLTERTHNDYTDASSHIINILRKRKDGRNNDNKTNSGADKADVFGIIGEMQQEEDNRTADNFAW